MRLIDADKLKQHYAWWNNEEQRTFDQIVDAQPTVEAVVHGEWIRHVLKNANVPWGHDCSACGEWFVISEDTAERYHYCPNCGAKMDGGADNG